MVNNELGARKINKALLCYLPIGLYQRGEERCQADIEGSATQAPHAPNDLGYLAAKLKEVGVTSVIRDYPVEKTTEKKVFSDIKLLNPDIIVVSTTYSTLQEDTLFLKRIKSLLPNITIIVKGSCFYFYPLEELSKTIYSSLDIAIYGEAEFIINDIVNFLRCAKPLHLLRGLVINLGSDSIARTLQPDFFENLDTLPFPDRDLIKNKLYKYPNTGRPMATIVVSRGCPAQCIYCLTPLISGRKLRKRSVDNVLEEVKHCVNNYGIRDFFFRADTFTMDRNFVTNLCKRIIEQNIKISWVANSRTDTVDREILNLIRDAGCWLIAFGIESGNDEIQKKIKKDTTARQACEAVKLCKETGLKTFGFFMIGFPWDNEETVRDTFRLMKVLDCDFIEVHIAMPFDGTPLNTICKDLGLLKESLVGYNYFSNPYTGGTLYLSRNEIIKFRKKMILSHYLRPSYIYRTLKSCNSPTEYLNYLKYGCRLIRNIIKI